MRPERPLDPAAPPIRGLREERQILIDDVAPEGKVRTQAVARMAAPGEMDGLTYALSHDLRAPLRSIDAFARILAEDHGAQLDDEGRRVLGIILRNSARLGALIDDLVTLSRLGCKPLEPRPVDMEALACDVAGELRAAELDRSITFRIGSLRPARGDPALLRLVWHHLFGNAVKFTRGRRTARITVSSAVRPDACRYIVKDNGAGYDSAYAGKLFVPFQRLHPTDAFEGTGIGLAIVAKIVERHGGAVWSKGVAGRGASFGFSIPEDTR